MPGTPKHIFILRLALATMLALFVPWLLGPDEFRYRIYVLSLSILTVLSGVLRQSTKEGGLIGEMATGAMALLLIAPAVGVRASRVADAVFTATHIAPHEALFQLPTIAQTVPNASGPLLLGAGLAILTICGRLGAVYAGIIFGAATAAWIGHTMAIEAGRAMHAERFEDAVLYAQAMRFVGLTVIIGAIAGFPFYRRGKVLWREALHQLIYDERFAEEQAKRDEEIARVKAAHAELKAREAAAETKRQKEEEESSKGLTIDELENDNADDDPGEEGSSDNDGEGGGFGEEDYLFEDEPDDDDDDDDGDDGEKEAKQETEQEDRKEGEDEETHEPESPDPDGSNEDEKEPELPAIELEPRFDIESPIVIEVEANASDPDLNLAKAAANRMRRVIGGLVIVCCLTAGWTATPPWFEVLGALPDSSTHIAVPFSDPGLSIARPPMDPFSKGFDQELANRKHGRLHGASWSCLQDTAHFGRAYGTADRAIEQLAVPADTPVVDLYPAIQSMRKRGVYTLGLTGRADPPYGPMGALFAWPAVQLLLDRPPRAIQWMQIEPRNLTELPLLPGKGTPKACALLVDPEVTIEHLFHTTRSLGSIYGDKRCRNGIALVFPEDGSTTNSNPAWRGCP